nr:helix-turn-helix transcriptional regulator [Joostella atrarenae]
MLISIGSKVKSFRKSRGMSQHDLSIEVNIPKDQVGRIERAEVNTGIITLHKIAKALNCEVFDVVRG